MPEKPVIIIGAGLAGLCCALRLRERDIPFRILEAADAPGGRIRTDRWAGFLLDRGFQVLLTAYPEAKRVLNYEALDLHCFDRERSFSPMGASTGWRTRSERRSRPFRACSRRLAALRISCES